jgi:hypothetical protein
MWFSPQHHKPCESLDSQSAFAQRMVFGVLMLCGTMSLFCSNVCRIGKRKRVDYTDRLQEYWLTGAMESGSEKHLKLSLKFNTQTQSPTPSSCHQINKVMVTLERAMKAHRGSRGIDLLFL